MANWTLRCLFCSKYFAHSEAIFPRLTEDPFGLPPKPDFPLDGSILVCPHCSETGVYARQMLTFDKAGHC